MTADSEEIKLKKIILESQYLISFIFNLEPSFCE